MNHILCWTASIKGRLKRSNTVVEIRDMLKCSVRTRVAGHKIQRQVNWACGDPKPGDVAVAILCLLVVFLVAKALPLLGLLRAKAIKLAHFLGALWRK